MLAAAANTQTTEPIIDDAATPPNQDTDDTQASVDAPHADDRETRSSEDSAADKKLILRLIRADFLYAAEDYFGDNRDIRYADAVGSAAGAASPDTDPETPDVSPPPCPT